MMLCTVGCILLVVFAGKTYNLMFVKEGYSVAEQVEQRSRSRTTCLLSARNLESCAQRNSMSASETIQKTWSFWIFQWSVAEGSQCLWCNSTKELSPLNLQVFLPLLLLPWKMVCFIRSCLKRMAEDFSWVKSSLMKGRGLSHSVAVTWSTAPSSPHYLQNAMLFWRLRWLRQPLGALKSVCPHFQASLRVSPS